ncbi:glutathione S-transferase [Aquabacterium sp.]|uniref:glutathione S-transferase n=1 Tax=Aquabacterium sp. TaxID=1872578 RepID=UPI0019A10917|nr:glutathione S-transferase [Aquabacterium sp.]MBC7700753.1 glutathione S-transferase [Aquabacterium sp.]
MPQQPILYSFRRCPYAIRARLALKCAQVPLELREVALRHKPEAMLAISPKGTVPVLQLPGGQIIDESLDIMNWALQQADPQGCLPRSDDHQATHDLIARNDGPFKVLLDCYKYPERHPGHTRANYRNQAIELCIHDLNQRLIQAPCLLGDKLSLADMAIVPFIRQFAQVDADWFAGAPFPALRIWLNQWVESPLFHAVMAKHPVWQAGDGPIHLIAKLGVSAAQPKRPATQAADSSP